MSDENTTKPRVKKVPRVLVNVPADLIENYQAARNIVLRNNVSGDGNSTPDQNRTLSRTAMEIAEFVAAQT